MTLLHEWAYHVNWKKRGSGTCGEDSDCKKKRKIISKPMIFKWFNYIWEHNVIFNNTCVNSEPTAVCKSEFTKSQCEIHLLEIHNLTILHQFIIE